MTTTAVRELPILFSGEMVRAILSGDKTVTRRVVKDPGLPCSTDEQWRDSIRRSVRCPYGEPGTRLWVREGFIRHASIPQLVGYVADGCEATEHWERRSPSIHMPRRFSRITLEVVSVRAERLHEITEEDVIEEGCPDFLPSEWPADIESAARITYMARTMWFPRLWDEINAKRDGGVYAWDRNPWVWRVEFRRVQP